MMVRPTRSGRLSQIASVIVAIAVLLVGCTAAPAPTGATGPAPAAGGTLPAGSVPKNTFTLALQSDPATLDPAVATDLPGRSVLVNLYEPLMRYENKPPVPVPNLAESISATADSKTYTVKLRPNLKFHDGSAVDAAAVVYSMDRVLAMNKGGSAAFKGVMGVGDTKEVDKQTVQFNLRTPSAVFPGTLSFFFIVNPKIIKANALPTGPYGANGDYAEQWLQTHDAGSGPYLIKARTPNAQIEMEAYPGYWRGWKESQYGTFTAKITTEPATAGLLLKQGVVDGLYENFPLSVFNDLATAPNVTVHTNLGIKPMYIFLNNKKAPTNNPKFRQAVAYAFDYEQAIKIAPGAERLPGPLPKGMWGAIETPAYTTNLEKAKALLAESGVTPGSVTLEFGSLGGPASVQTKVALLLQDGLAKIGVGLSITNHAWADILAQMSKAETTKHVYTIQLAADYADPDALLFQGWHTAGHGAWSGSQWYTNPKVDDLLQQGRVTTDPEKRRAFYTEAQQLIMSESPGLFMMNIPIQVALSKSVGGYDFIVSYYNYQVYKLFKQS